MSDSQNKLEALLVLGDAYIEELQVSGLTFTIVYELPE